MDTQALRWFRLVADGATVTEVAELTMMSQPGISRALARLEKDVGAPLFRKHGRQLALTHAGVAFRRHAADALRSLDEGLAAVAQQVDPEAGTVMLAFQPSLGTWLVPDLVGAFRAEHPRVRFDLHAKPDERRPAVGPRSRFDVELSTLESPAGADRTWRPLLEEPVRLLIPHDHRLAGRRSAALHEVAADPFVSVRETSLLRTQLDLMCGEAGVDVEIAFVADDLATLRGYVAAGLGVALIPARWDAGAAEPPSPRVRYLELEDRAAQREVGLSWSRGRALLPAAELFRTFVLERAAAGALPQAKPVA